MRKFYGIITIIIMMICLLPTIISCAPKSEPVVDFTEKEDTLNINIEGLKIIIDAGHGGADKGKIGVATGRQESDVNLEIAKKLQAALFNEGAKIIMTRETKDMIAPSKEEDMKKREQIILDSSADMFISIHQNSFEEESKYGPQVFFLKAGTAGEKLAEIMQEELNTQLEIKAPRIAIAGEYQLLKPGKQPSIIIECGFFSNKEEEAKLQTTEYQDKIVKAVVDGVKKYTGTHIK